MNISGPFIRRPIGTSLLAMGVFAVGLICYVLLGVAALPNMQFPVIFVQALEAGADAHDHVAGVEDIRRLLVIDGTRHGVEAHRPAVAVASVDLAVGAFDTQDLERAALRDTRLAQPMSQTVLGRLRRVGQ